MLSDYQLNKKCVNKTKHVLAVLSILSFLKNRIQLKINLLTLNNKNTCLYLFRCLIRVENIENLITNLLITN